MLCALMLIALVLAACTAAWRAPVESRGQKTASPKPSRIVIRTDHYRVQRGDTLYAIAWQKGVDYRLDRQLERYPSALPDLLRTGPAPDTASREQSAALGAGTQSETRAARARLQANPPQDLLPARSRRSR